MWYMSYRPVRSTFLRQKPAVEPSICLCLCICVLANMSFVSSSKINIYWAETSCGGTQSLSLKRKISDFSCGSVNTEHRWTLNIGEHCNSVIWNCLFEFSYDDSTATSNGAYIRWKHYYSTKKLRDLIHLMKNVLVNQALELRVLVPSKKRDEKHAPCLSSNINFLHWFRRFIHPILVPKR